MQMTAFAITAIFYAIVAWIISRGYLPRLSRWMRFLIAACVCIPVLSLGIFSMVLEWPWISLGFIMGTCVLLCLGVFVLFLADSEMVKELLEEEHKENRKQEAD